MAAILKFSVCQTQKSMFNTLIAHNNFFHLFRFIYGICEWKRLSSNIYKITNATLKVQSLWVNVALIYIQVLFWLRLKTDQFYQLINKKIKVSKDGRTRIWNTVSNKLIRTIVSPNETASSNMYADIPSIDLNNSFELFYAINNEIFYFN